jgi:hypothetical protein
MSSEPLEYLRHIAVEADFVTRAEGAPHQALVRWQVTWTFSKAAGGVQCVGTFDPFSGKLINLVVN